MSHAFEFARRTTGSGPPLVLVHGALADLRMWGAVSEALARRFAVHAYTQRYFGPAPWDAAWPPFSYDTHAADLLAFLRTVVGGPAHVVGWSYGADVALLAATVDPAPFAGLLLYEPGRATHVQDAALLAEYEADAAAMFGPVFEGLASGVPLDTCVERLIDGSGVRAGYFRAQPATHRAEQLANARTLPLQLRQPPARVVGSGDIAALRMPVRLVRGSGTRPLFRIATDGAAAATPARTALVVPGASHMLPLENPQEFAALVARELPT